LEEISLEKANKGKGKLFIHPRKTKRRQFLFSINFDSFDAALNIKKEKFVFSYLAAEIKTIISDGIKEKKISQFIISSRLFTIK
jgi:hypothetical protein